MFDLKHKSPNSYVLFVYTFKYNITYFNTSTPLTHKHLNYFKYRKNNTLSKNTPLLQKIKLDKIQQEGLIWGHRGWVRYIYLV